MRVVGLEALLLAPRFARDDRRTKDEIAKERAGHGRRGRKGEDVRGPAPTEVAGVQTSALLFVDDGEGQPGFRQPFGEHGEAQPPLEFRPRGQPGFVTRAMKIEDELHGGVSRGRS